MSATALAVLPALSAHPMTGLPSRPPRRDGEPAEAISATERVKPSTDKPEPRFEAARLRVAREDALRARAEAARQARVEGDDPAAADDETVKPAPKGFSFNLTSKRPSGGEPKGTAQS